MTCVYVIMLLFLYISAVSAIFSNKTNLYKRRRTVASFQSTFTVSVVFFDCITRNEQFESGSCGGWSGGEDMLLDFSDDKLLPERVRPHGLRQLRLHLDEEWEGLPDELLGHR